MEQPLIVQAEFSFKGGNNDELCFKRGDLITVTQREEGGWWEGTLNDKTGWFPSNYVNEYKAPLPITETIRPPEEIQEYRSVVLKDLLDSERAHVAEVEGLLENFLEPLQQTQILSSDEYAQLMGNFLEVVRTHDELLAQMEECNDRIGKLFLTKAPIMKQVHQSYCATHPKAIVILDKHKDELEKYMERQGAATPGLLVLTTGLSKPFRRLDKYSAMLQELERHMESSHPDRGDTQRSVAVYKDIAATCSATRRQKELELQVLTGPVRGWQGQELSLLGEIIHMGSVAVGPDHRDRYFVMFPQTLLILSVSQRMSAFIYEGKLPLTGIVVNRLEDTDTIKNAFEISGPLIERIVAVCQGPNEANKWVELLTSSSPGSIAIGIKRQLSNLSNSSLGGSNSVGNSFQQQQQQHMSPPHNLSLVSQRINSTTMSGCQMPSSQPMAVPQVPGMGGGSTPQSQHKRSLSFNHHLSYNQYAQQQQQPQSLGAIQGQQPPLPQHHHHPLPPQSLPNHPVALPVSHKQSSLVPTSNSISKTITQQGPPMGQAQVNMGIPTTNVRIGNTKANWSIANLRPAPPLRPSLLNAGSGGNSSSGGGSGGGSGSGGSSSNTLSSYCNGRKTQPTFEEDALVLRVFEAYCSAYQNNARNTIHSALQPWTPCLPIRGGKLQTSKAFSTSNPQLPFLCNTGGGKLGQQTSSSSLNSSFIWREASPNNFNLYSSSVSSLNAGGTRYSLTTAGSNAAQNHTNSGLNYRALSEERATRKSLNRLKSGFGSGYDNIFMTPLLPRKNKAASPKLMKSASSVGTGMGYQRSPPTRNRSEEKPPTPTTVPQQYQNERYPTGHPGLYDRRLNRSFETSSNAHRYAGYGGGYMLAASNYGSIGTNSGTSLKLNTLRRSTPHLGADDGIEDAQHYSDDTDASGCGTRLLGNGALKDCSHAAEHCLDNGSNCTTGLIDGIRNRDGRIARDPMQRHSGSWCCGLENEDMTPTLRQLWTAIRQMQQEMSQMKLQINEERALRVSLQQLLMQHLETGSTVGSGTTSKC